MIIERDNLSTLRQDLGEASVALRLGSYDVLHTGHRKGLGRTAMLADILVVGVMPDEYVSRVKGPARPYNPAYRRIEAIDKAEEVDYSFIAPDNALGILRAIHALRPTVYAESEDHARYVRPLKAGVLRAMGIDFTVIERQEEESTTLMVERFGISGALARSSLDFRFEEGTAL